MFTLFVSLIWRGKEKMQNPNKSGSFPSPEGVSGHRAGLLIKHVKLSSGMASRIMYANNEGTWIWSL